LVDVAMPIGGTESRDDHPRSTERLRSRAWQARLHAYMLSDSDREMMTRLLAYAEELDSEAAAVEVDPPECRK
jgi:hypothetical protein